jgi:hypothetical protein
MIRNGGTLKHDSPACTDLDNAELLSLFVVAGMACVKKSAASATAKDGRVLEGPSLVSGYQTADSSAA